ncbi:flagellar basal body rod protein FlgF [Buttiauxella warmboldiae]|uniref:Flagellar basal-body rod protein FlgF n=1 Tax=Buttiauxella warmboldiae TaxID=82993 RepID=A0A3N5DPC1_9ENTR|nr:flagellar basal body rod protein FlgF [Buttiauxella warmboldiae]RPH29447.1 flagellar basal body rod protein FlgF [Buttiauxella warmboldiae]
MDHLIYTAMSGASRSLMQQQVHANNLSNVNTSGFRGDLDKAMSSQVQGSGYDSRYVVQNANGGVNMASGSLEETGRDLDVGIVGNGLIALQLGGREVYTRNGHINVSPDGDLTINGQPVMGEGGPIVLPPFAQVSIAGDGTISIVPQDGDINALMDVDRIKLVDVATDQLSKDKNGFLVSNNRIEPRSEEITLANKHLENSNVSAISEMISSLALNRSFEAQVKMMKVAEDLAQAGNRVIRNT